MDGCSPRQPALGIQARQERFVSMAIGDSRVQPSIIASTALKQKC